MTGPARYALLSMLLFAFSPASQAAYVVNLDVPPLATAGSALGFEFQSFQFNVYLVPIGDPVADYAANVVANDRENYTYLSPVACGSGRGGGYCPPTYAREPGSTYSDAYVQVTQPPTALDVSFHFSGADAAGQPLAVSVLDSGSPSLELTADAGNVPVALGTPLGDGFYTLHYRTDSLAGSQVILSAVPEPAAALQLAAGLMFFVTGRRAFDLKGRG